MQTDIHITIWKAARMHPTADTCDALFIGAHPDDGELLAGGLMASMARKGHRVVLADATAGEMGTRGTPEVRYREGQDAAAILGVERMNLGLPDGSIGEDMAASIKAVVRAIRGKKPKLVVTHSAGDHHPDHNSIHLAVKQAFFLSNVLKYESGQERHAPTKLMYFWSHRHDVPPPLAFIADVSDVWDIKMKSMKAHRSQLAGGEEGGPETYLTSDLFWHRIEARHAFFGSLIRTRYAEPYLVEGVLRIDDPLALPEFGGIE